MRADEEHGVEDGQAWRDEVERAQVGIALELGAEELSAVLRGGAPEDGDPIVTVTLGAPDEQELRARPRRNSFAEMRLHLVGEAAPAERIVGPEPVILDEDPVVDAAGSRCKGLGDLA